MEAVRATSCTDSFFKSRVLYLFCLEAGVEEFPVASCPCLNVYVRYAHVAEDRSMQVRRRVLVADKNLLSRLSGIKAPLLVEVTNSCDFTWHEENHGAVTAPLIWDFQPLPSVSGAWLPMAHQNATDFVEFPLVADDKQKQCNCSSGQYRDIILPRLDEVVQGITDIDVAGSSSSSESEGERASSSEDEEAEALYTVTMRVRGATFPENQKTVKALRGMGPAFKMTQVRLQEEPDNVRDKNAVRFEVFHDDSWTRIGYVGVQDIPRVHVANKNNQIKSIKIAKLRQKYVKEINSCVFIVYCDLTKQGPWGKIDTNNFYNKNLHL